MVAGSAALLKEHLIDSFGTVIGNKVGHTYSTYQPLMPHEFLHKHHRTYHQSYNMGMGLNRTKVIWHGTPLRTDLHTVRKFFSIAR